MTKSLTQCTNRAGWNKVYPFQQSQRVYSLISREACGSCPDTIKLHGPNYNPCVKTTLKQSTAALHPKHMCLAVAGWSGGPFSSLLLHFVKKGMSECVWQNKQKSTRDLFIPAGDSVMLQQPGLQGPTKVGHLWDTCRHAINWADPQTHRPGQPHHSHWQGHEASLLGNHSQIRKGQ